MRGVIVKGIAGFYFVSAEDGLYRCKARGIFKKGGISPLVGDDAEIEILEDGDAVINAIGKRKNEFLRPPISNVDCFVVVVAAVKPKPNFSIIDRILAVAEKNQAEVLICINKTDIAEKERVRSISEIYESVYPVVCVSALAGVGVDQLRSSMLNGKYALAGPSGAGKSTLLNAMQPSANAAVSEISRKTSRGKHTTRHTEIFDIGSGTMICDTPGFTSFSVADVEPDELQHLYPEIAGLYGKCEYKNCMHIKEDGCAVKDAVESGGIHESRYRSYSEIYREIVVKRKYLYR